MSARSSSGLQSTLLTQAAVTALFSLLPGNGTGSMWLVVQLALAAAAAGTAWYVGTGARQAYTMALAFEGVALAAGVIGLTGHRYIPGTIIGVGALVRLLSNRQTAETAPQPAEEPSVMDAPAPDDHPALAAASVQDQPVSARPVSAFVPPPPLVPAGASAVGAATAPQAAMTAYGDTATAARSTEVGDAPSGPPIEPAFEAMVPAQVAAPSMAVAEAYTQRMPVHSELTELAMSAPAEPEPTREPAPQPPRAVVAPGRMAVDILPGKAGKRRR
jgi:hypothetical protein